MALDPRDFPDQGGGEGVVAPGGLDPSQFPDQPDPTPTPATPATDKAIEDTETLPQQLSRVFAGAPAWLRQVGATARANALRELHRPSPQWLHPFERSVREVAQMHGQIPVTPETSGPVRATAAVVNPILQAATIENAALGAAFAAQPEIGAALIAAKMAPGVSQWPEKLKQLPQMTPEEGLQFGTEFWGTVAAPFIHGPGKAFTPVERTTFPKDPYVQPDTPPPGAAPPPPVEPTETIPAGVVAPPEPERPPIDTNKQQELYESSGMFTKQSLQQHFPGWSIKALKEHQIISDAPGGHYFVEPVEEEGTLTRAEEERLRAATTPETHAEAAARYNEVINRFRTYGVDPDIGEVPEGASEGEIADMLEAAEDRIPVEDRRVSLAQGMTLQELRIAEDLRQKALDTAAAQQRTGTATSLAEPPRFRVKAEPGGGFRVTAPARTEYTEIAAATPKGKPTYQQRVIPGADLFLSEEGGELQPYASRKSGTAKVGVRGDGGEVGPKTPLRQPGETPPSEEPVSPGQRPVAPETPPAPAEAPRYVAQDYSEGKTPKGALVRDQQTGKVLHRFLSKDAHPTAEELADLRRQAREKAEELQKKVGEEVAKAVSQPEGAEPERRIPWMEIDPAWLDEGMARGLQGKELTQYLRNRARQGEQRFAGQGRGGAPPETPPEAPPPVRPVPGPRPGPKAPPKAAPEEPVPPQEPEGSLPRYSVPPNVDPGERRIFERVAGKMGIPNRWVHQGSKIYVMQGKSGDWNVHEPLTGKPFAGGYPKRRDAIDAHLSGDYPGMVEAEPDFTTVAGFEKEIRKKFGKEMTPEERTAFQPIAEEVSKLKGDAAKEASLAAGKVIDHYKDVKDIPIEKAVKNIQDAIDQATKPCR